MKPENTADLRAVAALLDDEDEGVAVSAIAELLNREAELGGLLAELQESPDPRMRRRVHQLQSALTLIRRRRFMAHLLRRNRIPFPEALIQIHLQWFDNDSITMIEKKYNAFIDELNQFPDPTLSGLGSAFASLGITAADETTLKVENYCIGTMLDERCGSAALWCGLICSLLPETAKARTVLCNGSFGVVDQDHSLLLPEKNWLVEKVPDVSLLKSFPQRALLRYALTNLFSAAVNSDSFRYILTISQAITGSESDEPLTALPYPYNPDLTDIQQEETDS